MNYLFFLLIASGFFCQKKSSAIKNEQPSVSLAADLTSTNLFTYKFTVTARDPESDPLTFTWDFGEGTIKQGNSAETFTYPADKTFTIKVKVSDGKSQPVEASVIIN